MFIWQTPPEWLMPSAQQERMTARSSAHSAMCGSQSETQRPLWPCCFQVRFDARIGESNSPIAVMTRPKLGGDRLAGELVEQRLGIEGIEVARAAFHEEEDDVLRLGREVRQSRASGESRGDGFGAALECGKSRPSRRSAQGLARQQVRHRHRAEPAAGAGESRREAGCS